MFGELVIAYLFLAGCGAGCVAVGSSLDLWLTHRRRGRELVMQDGRALGRWLGYQFVTGALMLAIGALALAFDLGRPDRIVELWLSPHATVMSVGAFALLVGTVLAGTIAAPRFLDVPGLGPAVVRALEVVAIPVSLVVAAYSGVLLQSLAGVAFWQTWLLPALFVASSASGGIAIAVCTSRFAAGDGSAEWAATRLARVDMIVIGIEAACALALVCGALAGGDETAAASARELVYGTKSQVWWIGFVGCGLVTPLALEAWHARGEGARVALVAASVLVLVGVLCLRAGVVDAGAHRELAFEGGEAMVALELPDGGES